MPFGRPNDSGSLGSDADCLIQIVAGCELFAELFAPFNDVDLEHVKLVSDYIACWAGS